MDVKFDTFKNGANDASANFVAIETNGSVALPGAGFLASPAFTMAGGGILNAWVDYVPGTLSVYLSQTTTKPAAALLTHALNLPTQLGNATSMYVGFTSSTGTNAQINEHDVYELELSTDGIPCACEGDTACTGVAGATPACAVSGICAICSATNHTACTGATPVCDVPVNTCVGCVTNADCAGPKPICNKSTNTCRACTGNADCGAPTSQCDQTVGSANLGQCVVCVADANCPPVSPRCNTAVNTCAQCLSGADCGGNTPLCKGGLCKPCASDADCTGTPLTPACEVSGACGQCSSTNGTKCKGGTAVCDFPTGTCVSCEFNTDCAGATPTCNTTTHTCRACLNNADCTGSPAGPACVTSGMKAGTCVPCKANADCTNPDAPRCDTTANQCVACLISADCPAATPACTSAHVCVGCLSDADCSGATPVCNGSNLCVGCLTNASCSGATPVCDTSAQTCSACQNDYAMSNPGPGSCPTAALPACQPAGSPLAGQCALCSSLNNSACATLPATPICITATATCGCVKDTDCNPDSYCNTSTVSSGTCAAGCKAGSVNNCATGKYCNVPDGGTVGTCMSEPCNSNTDCTAALPVCDTVKDPHFCVQCLNDSDCPSPQVCDLTGSQCHECTAQQTKNCSAAGKGAVCISPARPAAAPTDADCGDAMSGRVCDMTQHACRGGLPRHRRQRLPPAPDVLLERRHGRDVPGHHVEQQLVVVVLVRSRQAPTPAAGTGGAAVPSVITQSKGCGCRIAGDDDAPLGALAALLGRPLLPPPLPPLSPRARPEGPAERRTEAGPSP